MCVGSTPTSGTTPGSSNGRTSRFEREDEGSIPSPGTRSTRRRGGVAEARSARTRPAPVRIRPSAPVSRNGTFPGSSTVERAAVNRVVAGAIPARGASHHPPNVLLHPGWKQAATLLSRVRLSGGTSAPVVQRTGWPPFKRSRRVRLPPGAPTTRQRTTGCSSAWKSTRLGTGRPSVQIGPPRPESRAPCAASHAASKFHPTSRRRQSITPTSYRARELHRRSSTDLARDRGRCSPTHPRSSAAVRGEGVTEA